MSEPRKDVFMSDLRSDMFAADGCIKPNLDTRPYRIVLARKCEHTKIIGAVIDINAVSAEAATRYAADWLRLPEMHVHRVYEITPGSETGPQPEPEKRETDEH